MDTVNFTQKYVKFDHMYIVSALKATEIFNYALLYVFINLCKILNLN